MRCSRFNLQFFFSFFLYCCSPFLHSIFIWLNWMLCQRYATMRMAVNYMGGKQSDSIHRFCERMGRFSVYNFFFFAVFKLKFKDSRWHIAVNEFIGRKTANIFVVRFRFFVFFILLFFVLLSSMRYSHWKRTYHLIIKGKNVESFKKEKSLPRFCHWYCLC